MAAGARAPGRDAPGARDAARARNEELKKTILNPAQLAPLLVAPLYVIGQHFEFIADVPLPILVGALLLAQLTTSVATLFLPPGGPGWQVFIRVLLMTVMIGLNIYLIGWGAVLGIGFVFGAAENMRVDGARAGRYAIWSTVFVVAGGEALTQMGFFTSILPDPQHYGVAVLATCGTCLIIGLLAWTTADKDRAETELRNSEQRFRTLVHYASDVILVIAVDGRISYVSPAMARALGWGSDVERFGAELVHPDDLETVRRQVQRVSDHPEEVSWFEVQLRHVDGSWRWFEVGMTNRVRDPAIAGLVCNMRDVTERRRFQEQLAYQAYHDSLTRLPNRESFLARLEHTLAIARERSTSVAVLFLDVDRFKLVNDSLGHEVGDRLLIDVAERIRGCLRPGDLVARFGGDEFTVLLADLEDENAAITVAERILAAFREPVPLDSRQLFVSTSIGIALSRPGELRPGDLLRQADLAMYIAKEKGRSRWDLFDAGTAPHIAERLEIEGDLWRALEQDELVVHFQPEVNLETGEIAGAEALVRWKHPRRGLLLPGEFVPLAEESSLIVAIDHAVLELACSWARRWEDDPRELHVSVNLSPRFMRQPEAVAEISAVIRSTGINPRRLQLEITERTALTDLETTITQLHQLRALGIRVAIDDFGTGYSSLGYLKRLPVDVVKLDRSFVENMDLHESDVVIAQAVITMGHALGMRVTAEGVERPEQATRLHGLGCDTAMGWHWSRAVPPDEFATILQTGFGGQISRAAGDGDNVVRFPTTRSW